MGKLVKEFKDFAFKGNVVDMAVGVMIGGAFGNIVTSIVNDLVTPLIAKLTGSVDFSALKIMLGEGPDAPFIGIGNFIQTVFNFLIIAVCIFGIVKVINKAKKPAEAPKPKRLCPFCKSEIHDEATRCPHCTSELTR